MAQEILIDDPKYPKALKEALGKLAISLGPKKLYYKGNFDNDIFENCLAVVGSRHLTSYGRRITEQLVSEIAFAGVTIVSGFMYGGDETAHKATVRAGGKTIAVMPCGIDIVHPSNQLDLYREILKNNGLIISEYEGNFLPVNYSYVQRNRIVAGLSKAILVVEAGLNSGSLITASYAKKFGKKIFAVPGQITSEVSKGTIKLIKEGAEAVTCAGDILKYYNLCLAKPSTKTSTKKLEIAGLDNLEQKIIDQLKREPMEIDAIARFLNLPAGKIGTALSLLQLKGFVVQDLNKYYLN